MVKIKVKLPDGRVVDGERLDFEIKKENWNEYKTSDGSTVKVKVSLTDIVRLDEWDPVTGEPKYTFNCQVSFRVLNIPKHLFRKQSDRKVKIYD